MSSFFNPDPDPDDHDPDPDIKVDADLILIPILNSGGAFPWSDDPDLWLSEGEYGLAEKGD